MKRNSAVVATLLATVLAGALLGAMGCRSVADAPRLLVLGIDGMDPRILSRLMASGRMPHFSALAESGGFTSLATTMPPQSPVAWSTFITGLDPEGHGIFDFIHRDPATLAPYLSTSRKGADGEMELLRQGRPFWDFLVEAGIPGDDLQGAGQFSAAIAAHGIVVGADRMLLFSRFRRHGDPGHPRHLRNFFLLHRRPVCGTCSYG